MWQHETEPSHPRKVVCTAQRMPREGEFFLSSRSVSFRFGAFDVTTACNTQAYMYMVYILCFAICYWY